MMTNSWFNKREKISNLTFKEGLKVVISGFLRDIRDCGKLHFLVISDISGEIQVVVKNPELIEAFTSKKESVIAVYGTLKKKVVPNKNEEFGSWEIEMEEFSVLSESLKNLPFPINNKQQVVDEEIKLKHRYLTLRGEVKNNLIFRSKVKSFFNNYFINNEFIEITTPSLSVPSREGANTFKTPLMHHGVEKQFALAQSPQLYKQLLMISGYEKYFQFANVFRLEDLRSDRQYEFMQLDLEISYKDENYLFELIEKGIKEMLLSVFKKELKTPFIKITHKDAYEIYGSDKPDIRFENKIKDVSKHPNLKTKHEFAFVIEFLAGKDEIEIIKKEIPNGYSWAQKVHDAIIGNFESKDKDFVDEFCNEDGKIIFFVFSNGKEKKQALTKLGKIRTILGKQLKLFKENQIAFCWIVKWPLFEYSLSQEMWVPAHHLFTKPEHNENEINVESDFSKGYDLVLNGCEIASGSQRINDKITQLNMFKAAKLHEKTIQNDFGWFLEAMSYGVPPHLGIGIGIDRLMQILLNTESIRDVIAFPKNNHGSCQMTESPRKIQ